LLIYDLNSGITNSKEFMTVDYMENWIIKTMRRNEHGTQIDGQDT